MRFISLFSFVLLFSTLGVAQGVSFFPGDLQEAVEKAQDQGKLIFVDAYTTWCGPCKRMDSQVFPDNTVGDLFNEKFVNLKMDMETDRGRAFGAIHPVSAYPTLIFLDSKGELIQKVVGYKSVDALLELGREVLVDNIVDHSSNTYQKLQAVNDFKFMSQVHQGLDQDDFFWYYRSSMKLGPDDKMVLKNMSEAKNDWAHYRYEQQYKGIPVQGVSYQLHKHNNEVRSANGSFLPEVNVDIVPTKNAEEILKIAMKEMGAEKYSWQDHEHGAFCTHGSPEPSLCIIDRAYPDYSGNYALAYELDLVSVKPLTGNTYFIDAHTGKVLYRVDLHQHQGVPGKGVTKYYGEQDIIVDSLAPEEFILRDPTRGIDGINIWDDKLDNEPGKTFTSNSSYFDLTNDDQNEVAVDALYCTSRFYDLCRDELDWLGLDNMDASFNVSVHIAEGADFINAFWNGEFASFGNGDCNNGPLVTFEVLAHEFQHGITDYTSDLIYAEESGAINESMSDVIGKYAEWYFDRDNFSWLLGPSFQYQDDAVPFRDLADPESLGNPSYYKGDTWIDGNGVHTNSAIGNLFYVLLTDGGSGFTEEAEAYDVEGIGIEQAAKFIFHVNRNYLSENSGYNAYYEACVIAAQEFFNGDQAQVDNVIEAWKAVGLPNGNAAGNIMDLGLIAGGFEQVCGFGNYEEIVFSVENSGDFDYTSDMGASVIVEIGGFNGSSSIEIDIDTTLLPGESYEIRVDSFLLLDDDFLSVDYILEFAPDGNPDNNSEIQFFSVNEFEENDIGLFDGLLSDVSCYNDSIDVAFRIQNESCVVISEGTEIELFIEDETGVLIWSTPYILLDDFDSRRIRTINRTEELDIKAYNTLVLGVRMNNDPLEDNNSAEVDFKIVDWVDASYSNDFESSSYDEEIIINALEAENTIFQAGSNRFYTTGFSEEPFDPLCFESERNWESQVGFFSPISATMDLCADLSDAEKSTMLFDLIQYRNEVPGFTSLESSAMRVNWDSPQGSGFEIIKALPEGEVQEVKVPLPEGFQGTINMQFLTHAGTFQFNNDFLDYDLQFLDNLRFLPATVSVADNSLEREVNIYPNPATDELYVSTELDISGIEVLDVAGKTMMTTRTLEDRRVDVSQLQNGMYFILLKTSDNQYVKKRFVKAE